MACHVFLELLARDASAVEFEAPLVAARSAGAPAETLAELEQAKLTALRVRTLLRRRARREAELAALFDTAGDLAALRDVDAVLQAIVSRARRLLHADIAYMTLHDQERGDTHMRVTDGSVSAAFQSVRLPMGEGLGGLVAQSGIPYTTGDYMSDERFHHLPGIDSAVREEGLVAILGVPMRLGTRAIGVLFAANRTARPFAQEEVALLGSLAAHAAVAIDNARLLAETQAALDELSAAHKLIQARTAAVERAAQAHDRMTTLVVRGGGIEDVAAVVIDVLGGALAVLDADGRRLATVGDIGPLDHGEVAAAAAASRSLGRAVQRGDLHVATMATGAEVLGGLVLRNADQVHSTDHRILERAALVTALLLLFRRTELEAEARVRGDLLDDLLSGRPADAEALAHRARLVGVDPGASMVLVVARHDGTQQPDRSQPARAGFWAACHATAAHGLVTGRRQEIVLLLPGERAGDVARQVARELGAALGHPVTAGAAGPLCGLDGVPAAYQEARRCADALLGFDRAGHGASADELGFVGLLLADTRDVTGFLEQTLGQVTSYDARRGTALVATLEAYFGSGGGIAKVAQRLHIHVNTVTQRLDRIGRLLGDDWQSPDRALELQLALRLRRLRSSTEP